MHSGAEAFYLVDGEQCLETESRIYPMPKGATVVVPERETMRLVAMGASPRRALAVIGYDAAQPPTARPDNAPTLLSCTATRDPG